jgi:signal transduction histidine kinase
VEVLFTDDGPGIPDADHDRVFDPFYTTKDPGAGTGLGLAVCKHLVTRIGGSITVTNGPQGRGARFHVVIPIET